MFLYKNDIEKIKKDFLNVDLHKIIESGEGLSLEGYVYLFGINALSDNGVDISIIKDLDPLKCDIETIEGLLFSEVFCFEIYDGFYTYISDTKDGYFVCKYL